MDTNKILFQVNEIFVDVFDDPGLKIGPETTSGDVPEWDSLNHIQLVVAIEKAFKVRFTSQQIQGWKNVGAMCEDIAQITGQG